jgi:hypothetical protein
MDELLELRAHIEQGHYIEALALIGEMEEMSRDDKINKIESFLNILLVHLIKQKAEQRTTRSWTVSIGNALDGVVRANKRRKAAGYYLNHAELAEAVEEIYPSSLRQASLEAFEGRYDELELASQFDESELKADALRMVLDAQGARQQ